MRSQCLRSLFRFRQKVTHLDFKIYEKQGGVGGTWYANRYPVRKRLDQPKPGEILTCMSGNLM